MLCVSIECAYFLDCYVIWGTHTCLYVKVLCVRFQSLLAPVYRLSCGSYPWHHSNCGTGSSGSCHCSSGRQEVREGDRKRGSVSKFNFSLYHGFVSCISSNYATLLPSAIMAALLRSYSSLMHTYVLYLLLKLDILYYVLYHPYKVCMNAVVQFWLVGPHVAKD